MRMTRRMPFSWLPLSRLVLALLTSWVSAFYLPGVAPHEYVHGEQVEVKVNKLSSSITQLPYDYYELPLCRPKELTSKVRGASVWARAAVPEARSPSHS